MKTTTAIDDNVHNNSPIVLYDDNNDNQTMTTINNDRIVRSRGGFTHLREMGNIISLSQRAFVCLVAEGSLANNVSERTCELEYNSNYFHLTFGFLLPILMVTLLKKGSNQNLRPKTQ